MKVPVGQRPFPGFFLLRQNDAPSIWGLPRTYYLAGSFRAPLPTWIIHVPGAVFAAWILLLVTQTSFVSMRRVDLHRRLGIVGFGLACLMMVLGTCAATDALRRGVTDVGADAQTFYAGNILDVMIFGTFIFHAFRLRRNPAAHKTADLAGDIPANGRTNLSLAFRNFPAPSSNDLSRYWNVSTPAHYV